MTPEEEAYAKALRHIREADRITSVVQEWLGHADVSTTRLYDRRKSIDFSGEILTNATTRPNARIEAGINTMYNCSIGLSAICEVHVLAVKVEMLAPGRLNGSVSWLDGNDFVK